LKCSPNLSVNLPAFRKTAAPLFKDLLLGLQVCNQGRCLFGVFCAFCRIFSSSRSCFLRVSDICKMSGTPESAQKLALQSNCSRLLLLRFSDRLRSLPQGCRSRTKRLLFGRRLWVFSGHPLPQLFLVCLRPNLFGGALWPTRGSGYSRPGRCFACVTPPFLSDNLQKKMIWLLPWSPMINCRRTVQSRFRGHSPTHDPTPRTA
jgi:hypothetical protein